MKRATATRSGQTQTIQNKRSAQESTFTDNRPEAIAQRKLQRALDEEETPQLMQRKSNGLPNNLQAGVESLSGQDMSDVNVHYNSSEPSQLQAHAFAQGSDIHLASGQEQHLPHEAWHVAQQKQNRVPVTSSVGGQPLNDDPSLETEADVMGQKALQGKFEEGEPELDDTVNQAKAAPAQLMEEEEEL